MRTYNLEADIDKFQELFDQLKSAHTSLITWRVRDDGTKDILTSEVVDFDISQAKLVLDFGKENEGFSNDMIFYFIKSELVIFKAPAGELPKEFKKLDEEEALDFSRRYQLDQEEFFVKGHGFANKINDHQLVKGRGAANIHEKGYLKFESQSMTDHIDNKWRMSSMSEHDSALFETELSFVELDAEDEKYASKRAAPRARPSKGKMVKVAQVDNNSGFDFYSLFDLSRGGLSFLCLTESEFQINTQINILGFDTNQFESPMVVEVKAIRETDESRSLFKVGCSFIE